MRKTIGYRFFLVGLLVFAFTFSCKNEDDPIPYAYVNFYIDLNAPDYNILNAIGGFVSVTGGYKGIIIYRHSFEEFYAFERACTYDPTAEYGMVKMDNTGLFAIDSVCGSKFSILLDGTPVDGPATFALKRYFATYNENTNILYITN